MPVFMILFSLRLCLVFSCGHFLGQSVHCIHTSWSWIIGGTDLLFFSVADHFNSLNVKCILRVCIMYVVVNVFEFCIIQKGMDEKYSLA